MDFIPPMRLDELAAIINADFDGDPAFLISGLNEIHVVRPGDITFVDHPKYYAKALQSKASAVLINQRVEKPEGKVLLFHEKPFDAFVEMVLYFRAFEPATHHISPTAKIGEGTVIQPGAFIGNHVVIGKNCIIHANASIYDHSVLGNEVIVHANSVIGSDGYYFQRRAEGFVKFESGGRAVLHDKVEVGALCAIDRGVTADTIIGKGTKLDNHCQIGHDTVIGANCLIGAHAAIAGVALIEDDVIIWGRVAINKDLVIGKGAVILATSAVDKSLQGGITYFGTPAEEARKKWREMAAIRQLPEIIKKLK